MRIQQDTVSLHARTIVEILREEFCILANDNGSLGEAARRLIEWDGDCHAESVAAALFHCFYHHLTLHLLVPMLGSETFRAYVEIFNQSLFPIQCILNDPASPWFAETSRRFLVGAALSDACEELRTRLGTEMTDWKWGKVHTLSLSHALDAVRGLKSLISIAPIPTGGDGVTINLGFFRRSRPYAHTVGASLRMIADLCHPPLSLFMTVPGQSGHFFSPHYFDHLQLWRKGDYVQLDADEKTTTDWPLLMLVPDRQRA